MNDAQDDKKILEHMPYLSLLIEDMKEVNRSLRIGGTGETEISILIADIPTKWLEGIKDKINQINDEYDSIIGYVNTHYRNNRTYTYKGESIARTAAINRTFSLKPMILSILDDKGILLLTRKNLAGKSFRIDDMDSD